MSGPHANGTTGTRSMTQAAAGSGIVPLDAETIALVRMSAAIAGAGEVLLREVLAAGALHVRPTWADELLIQSYLFAGFPRMLNAAREWRRVSGHPAPERDDESDAAPLDWRTRGEATCEAVYGSMYPLLRTNVQALHPAIDHAMVAEGYGRILGRPALDLPRRELCIIAACVVGGHDRQTLSHLHGAVNVGAPDGWVDATLDALADAPAVVDDERILRARMLWARVQGK